MNTRLYPSTLRREPIVKGNKYWHLTWLESRPENEELRRKKEEARRSR